jgi:hypothetical protein
MRTFISPFASDSRRQFCGYCGTQLTSWHERTRDDSEHICLTVGSLLDEDQAMLGTLGYLPGSESSDEGDVNAAGPSRRSVARPEPQNQGAEWFEDMVEHSSLGRVKKQHGGHVGPDVNVRVEWEVVEWTEGDGGDDADDESLTPSKRKISHVEAGDDVEMRIV